MAISLAKTLQTVAYTLYIRDDMRFITNDTVEVSQSIYESSGHYTDQFLPIIQKSIIITNSTAIADILAVIGSDYTGAITIAEQYLIDNDAYYATGTIVA